MKKSVIISLIIMALCVVVGVIGVTAAWFGDTLKRDDKVIISSYAPTGNATMSIDSVSEYTSGVGLMPAIAAEGYILGRRNGNEHLDSIDVLSSANVTAGYISQVATQVTMDFDFTYAGTADAGYSNKAIEIKLASVTLQNPRVYVPESEYTGTIKNSMRYIRTGTGTDNDPYVYTQDDEGTFIRTYLDLPDYKSEFNFEMSLAKYFIQDEYDNAYSGAYYVRTNVGVADSSFALANPQPTAETFHAEGAPRYYLIDENATYNWYNEMTDNYSLYIEATPREEAKFSFNVNFARVDEETNPILRNATLFFNFEIDSLKSSDRRVHA